MSLFVVNIFVILIVGETIQTFSTEDNTLQQVHVIFRHGDRTPDKICMYPNDPHLNDTWFPYGLGALTNLGKKQEYELGRSLRKRYNAFLGDLYFPNIQEARSTSIPRAKDSLQLVLAGLWPPNKEQTFVHNLPWQPIDYIYKEFEEDELLGFPFLRKNCIRYFQDLIKMDSSDEVKSYYKRNRDKINYINMNSGLKIVSLSQLMKLYFGLYAEEHTNRTLPEWTKAVYPEFLQNASAFSYVFYTATNNMLKASVGQFVKKVLKDSISKIERRIPSGEKKIFLYSGHEYNIAHVLRALQSFKLHIPEYSSHIIFELHTIGCKSGFKIYYQDMKGKDPQLLTIPGCEQFCPIEEFENLMKDILPDSHDKC